MGFREGGGATSANWMKRRLINLVVLAEKGTQHTLASGCPPSSDHTTKRRLSTQM
jgi:hypothetical protein